MRSPEFQTQSGGDSGTSGIGSGSNSSPNNSGSPGSSTVSGNSPAEPILGSEDPNGIPQKTLADELAANIAAIGALMAGSDSLQPVAPQAPGDVLAGRFPTSSTLMQNWKVWAIVAVVVVAGFYFWKRNKG